MTITTSKQLAEALGPKWAGHQTRPFLPEALCLDSQATVLSGTTGGRQVFWARMETVTSASSGIPRAAVLALADKLEAEARALRESVREGP